MHGRKQEGLTNCRGQGLDADDQSITSERLTVSFTNGTRKDDLALQSDYFVCTGVCSHASNKFALCFLEGARNNQQFKIHAAFVMEQAVLLIQRSSREAESFFVHDMVKNDTALDKFHFCSRRSRDIQQGAHFAKGESLFISFNIYLKKDVASVRRAKPHRDKSAKNNAKEQENK